MVCCAAEQLDAWRSFLETLSRDNGSLPGHAQLKYAEDRCVIRADHPCGSGRVAGRMIRSGGLAAWLGAAMPSPARRDFERMRSLLRSGVSTATPLAYIERSVGGRESWLVTAFLDDATDLARIVLTTLPRLASEPRTIFKRRLSRAVARWLAASVNMGWRHRDFKASNVLIRGTETESPTALVVDLEGLARRRSWHGVPGRCETVRLIASLLGRPTLQSRDVARFLRDFSDQPGVDVPESIRGFLADAENYLHRAQRRKTHKLDGFSGD